MILGLCRTFLELGDAVSRNLALAHRDDCYISYGEETITETCLLEIHRRHSKIVKIKTFTKREEARNGADWEWCLVGRKHTFKMRVQAKRLAKGSRCFRGLLTYTAQNALHPQITMLINDALAHSLFPAICLYSPNDAKKKWKVSASGHDFEFGCLVGDARKVHTSDRELLEHVCVPWHYLACPKTPLTNGTSSPNAPALPNIQALNGELGSLEGQGISETPEDWSLESGLDDNPDGYVKRGIMGVLRIDCRELT